MLELNALSIILLYISNKKKKTSILSNFIVYEFMTIDFRQQLLQSNILEFYTRFLVPLLGNANRPKLFVHTPESIHTCFKLTRESSNT
jgi:hypothetical protein